MGCSHVVHAGATILGSFSNFSTAHKSRRAHLINEILTYCNILYRRGKFKLYYDVSPVSAELVRDLATDKIGRAYLFKAHIQYVRPPPSTISSAFASYTNNPAPPNMTPGRSTTVTILKAEATGLIYRAWEPYQREPRWEIQAELLEKLLERAEQRMKDRFGGNYRAKLLRKAMGDDVALDERHAYATLHTMGGPDGGGEWVHVPSGMDDVPREMQHPRRDVGDWDIYQEWRRMHAEELEQAMLGESRFIEEEGSRRHHKLLEAGRANGSSGIVTPADGRSSSNAGRRQSSSSAQRGRRDASRGSATRSTPTSSEPSVQPDKKRKKKRYLRSAGTASAKASHNEPLEPISSNNEASGDEVEEKAEAKA